MATKKSVKTTLPAPFDGRVKVRMYRQGLGDCFLITLPRKDGNPYTILIDCGVVLGTSNPGDIMTKVAQNILDETGGHIDLLLVTHEHWDHLSGFVQAPDLFKQLHVDSVWLAWTEKPNDPLAAKLKGEAQALRMALMAGAARLRMAGELDSASEVASMLEFFGAAGATTTDALRVVKGMTPNIRFCFPSDPPVDLPDTEACVYVLGPPYDEKLIKKYNPSASHPETYGIDSMNLFLNGIAPALNGEDESNDAFDKAVQIPLEAAKQMPFFQTQYFGEDAAADGNWLAPSKDQSWRRIDTSWLDSSSSLALQLDSATNNTSLVIAIELGGKDVLLFAADAQVGNWLSWQNLSWTTGGRTVTGPELLKRTIFYKVGHHGSHNATLEQLGLEMMTALEVAMIPVNHEMAVKKRWGNMPLPKLVSRLDERTKGRVLRIDADVPPALADKVKADDLFYELTL